MRRTDLERAIALLKKDIEKYQNYKKRILDYVEKLKNKCLKKEITYFEYEQLIAQKLDGKTVQEWIDYYNSRITHIEKRIEREVRKTKIKKVLFITFSFFLVSLLLF